MSLLNNTTKLQELLEAVNELPKGINTSDANGTPDKFLEGYSGYVNNVKVIGNIPSKSAATITPSTTEQIITAGQYLSGNQTVLGDANLVAENIASGKTIFGVSGTLEANSMIIVTAPTGSTITASNGSETKVATEDNGTWTFLNCDIGTWTISATKDSSTATQTVSISEQSQLLRYYVTITYFSATINVTYPAGSTCTCTKGDTVLTAANTSGSYAFTVGSTGTWTVKAVSGSDSDEQSVTISTQGQSVSVSLSYQLYASDFDWNSYGTLYYDYEIVDDNDGYISQSEWSTTKNWRARLLTSGRLKTTKAGKIDVFCVGGGGAGGYSGKEGGYATGSGAGSGYTNTRKQVSVTANSTYTITVGAGGVFAMKFQGNSGGTTSAFGLNAAGGYGGLSEYDNPSNLDSSLIGGNGGSGGNGRYGDGGGTDGYDGSSSGSSAGGKGQRNLSGPNGETGTTREFGETTGRLYSNGGSIYGTATTPKSDNTGDGGDVGPNNTNSNDGTGGSGIVVIRNAR